MVAQITSIKKDKKSFKVGLYMETTVPLNELVSKDLRIGDNVFIATEDPKISYVILEDRPETSIPYAREKTSR